LRDSTQIVAVKMRYDELIARLRAAAAPERPVPAELSGYLEKVRLHAYKITDSRRDAL
jgi:hypothetical protein